MNPDWNVPIQAKVYLYVNRVPGTAPYLSYATKPSSDLPVVLKQLSGRFSPIQKRNPRIYVFEDETWEVKGQFSTAMEDKTPVQWSMEDDGSLALRLLAVGVILILSAFITYIIFRMILWMTI
jgi:hypothetical protein